MEIPASLFFCCWASIGVVALLLGCDALNKTTLPASVSPAVLSLFKNFLAVAASHSSTYTLFFRRPKPTIHMMYYYYTLSYFALFPIVCVRIVGDLLAATDDYASYIVVNALALPLVVLPFWKSDFRYELYYLANGVLLLLTQFILSVVVPNMYTSFGFIMVVPAIDLLLVKCFDNAAFEGEKLQRQLHFSAELLLLVLGYTKKHFSFTLVLPTTFLTCIAQAAISGDERFQRWMPAAMVQQSRIFSIMKWKRKEVEFAIGMAGTILFQRFVKLSSLDHVVVFLYFMVAWLANLALLLCCHDGGVFIFFLTNVMVGSAVSEFGLGRMTWVIYGASLLLFIIRRNLLLLCVVYRDDEEAVVCWRQNQTDR